MAITKEEAGVLVENLADILSNPNPLEFDRIESLPSSALIKMAQYLQIRRYS